MVIANLAQKCKAFAKALHYKELKYKLDPHNIDTIESLIYINTMLGEQESTQGLLKNISTQTSESERLARYLNR
jgi:FKBP12-rapamycin complex-associated protein